MIGAPTYPMLRDATVASLLEVLDRNRIPHEINRAENFVVNARERSRGSYSGRWEEFEKGCAGATWAWFGLDELTYTAEQAWLRLEGRLRDPKASRLGGFAVWTPRGYDWVYERFVARKIEEVRNGDGRAFLRIGICWSAFQITTINGCSAVTTNAFFSRRRWGNM